MLIPERASTFCRAAWLWLRALLTIALASMMLLVGFLPWTTRIRYHPWSALYEYQGEIHLALAAFAGVCIAALIYFVVGHRFVATTVMAFIFMSATAALAALFGVAEERLGTATVMGMIGFPLLAAVATKAAKIASEKECDSSVYKKFKTSFEDALDVINVAELLLWTMAWASGGIGVFLLIKAIEIWR